MGWQRAKPGPLIKNTYLFVQWRRVRITAIPFWLTFPRFLFPYHTICCKILLKWQLKSGHPLLRICNGYLRTIPKVRVKVKVTQSCLILCDPPWNSPGQNTGVGSLFLLQRTFPTHGLNPGLLCCRRILYQLSHKGSPRILEWVTYPFSNESAWPRNRTGVSCIAGGFFTNWATREALILSPATLKSLPWP